MPLKTCLQDCLHLKLAGCHSPPYSTGPLVKVNDMVNYILSLTGMSDLQKLPEDTIRFVLEQNMSDGVLRLPKEYGMFIAC